MVNLTSVRLFPNLCTMSAQNAGKLNRLEKDLPEGLLVDAGWLEKRGYYGSLRKKYVDLGWLEQPAYRVYRRPRGNLSWEQAVISLQTRLDVPITVGGRTALERQGYAHYLPISSTEVHLYGDRRPPSWLDKLPLPSRFVFHRTARVFRSGPPKNSSEEQPWGHWNWPLTLSTPERAILELLDELPDQESFHQVDKLMEGVSALSPRRLQALLEACTSIKVKRLFFFFADRHPHAWLKRLDRERVNLGKGKRTLVKGGKFDPTYKITVPEDMDAL